MSDNQTDLEREKNKSYELGHIAQLNDIADELRERSGELYANSSRQDTKKAKFAKKLASEFEERAEDERDRWEDKYNE